MLVTQITQKPVLESRDNELLSSHLLISNEDKDTEEHKKYEEYCDNPELDLGATSPEILDQYTPQTIDHTIIEEKTRKTKKSEYCDDVSLQKCKIPLPLFVWGDSKCVWDIMMHKADVVAQTRNCRLFEETTTIAPRMRAILIEWMMEVCEVYHLRRSTYYLAVDYLDRYLSINSDVSKCQLQLLGISALYIAAKFEEIYPPKVAEFAYVCDGACTESEILLCERLLLHALSWDINPMTPTSWLNLYMQIHSHNKNVLDRNITIDYDANQFFVYPRYSAYDFIKASHLMDLFTLDPCYLIFKYNIIAASAMYYLYGKRCALKVSGLEWKDLESCIEYMAVFYTIIRKTDDPKLDSLPTYVSSDPRDSATFNFLKYRIPNLTYGENHSLQTRAVNIDHLMQSCMLRLQRMGFRISKENTKDEIINSDSEETEAVEKEESTLVFKVEKEDPPVVPTCTRFTPEIISTTMSDESEVLFNCKSELSLDDMIEGINEYVIKKVLISKRSIKDSDDNDTTIVSE